jgi:ribosomal protein L11 methyltransferase
MPVVEVEIDAADAELAADALWQAGPSAVSQVDLGDGRVRLQADVADLTRLDDRWAGRVVEPDGDAHLDAWRAWARPYRAGRRLLVHPAWLDAPDAEPGDVVIPLDPGRSFGSGSHPSTRLVLAVLEDVVRGGGERILDAGCGSGVLAIAACRLGAAAAVAVDIEPAAREATLANAARNGVTDQIEVGGELDAVVGPFDVVVANIGAAVLAPLAPRLRALTRPDGWLVLAGLLTSQADGVVAAYGGCVEVERRTEDGWAAPVLKAAR